MGATLTHEERRPKSQEINASVDFNGDGFPDLMTAGLFVLTVFLNQGDGSFREGFQTRIFAGQVELSDFDEDGVLDAIIVGSGVRLLFGDGQGSFHGRRGSTILEELLGQVAVDDFDGDGHDDLVTVYPLGIDWYRGRGDGGFDDPVTTALSLVVPPLFLASGAGR